MVLATVITIVNYDHTVITMVNYDIEFFIGQATGIELLSVRRWFGVLGPV
jgi:hypothetical protein